MTLENPDGGMGQTQSKVTCFGEKFYIPLEYPFLLTGSRWWADLKRCRFKHDGGVGGWLGGLRPSTFREQRRGSLMFEIKTLKECSLRTTCQNI